MYAGVSLRWMIFAALSFPCLAQVTTIDFLGSVADPSGGVIVGATSR